MRTVTWTIDISDYDINEFRSMIPEDSKQMSDEEIAARIALNYMHTASATNVDSCNVFTVCNSNHPESRETIDLGQIAAERGYDAEPEPSDRYDFPQDDGYPMQEA